MPSEIIRTEVAAKILGMKKQYLLDEIAAGRIDIGWYKPRGSKQSSHGTYKIFRAKLARFLGREPDYVWPEESE